MPRRRLARTGGRGTRLHPPWPPLSKGGKGYARRRALLRAREPVAEARVTTPPGPPLASIGIYTTYVLLKNEILAASRLSSSRS